MWSTLSPHRSRKPDPTANMTTGSAALRRGGETRRDPSSQAHTMGSRGCGAPRGSWNAAWAGVTPR